VTGRAAALIGPTPAYRRGLAVVLEEACFLPEEPAELQEWVRSVVGPLLGVVLVVAGLAAAIVAHFVDNLLLLGWPLLATEGRRVEAAWR
jgi:hypothetical protein